ncbi:hypothetical protein pdam_00024261, partial [Pocillopora damicornis]
MSKARNEFYTQFMEENSEDQGKLFSAAKELLAVENKLSFPDHLDKNKLANKAAKFFVIKVDGIPSEIDSMKILVTETHEFASHNMQQSAERHQKPSTERKYVAITVAHIQRIVESEQDRVK